MIRSLWPLSPTFRQRSIAGLLLLVILIVGRRVAHVYFNQAQVQKIVVSVAPVQIQTVPDQIELNGSIVPFNTVSVKARIDSEIVAVKVKDGDLVQKGDVLFQLDDRLLKAQMAQAQANLEREQAELNRAERQLKRDTELIKRTTISKEQFDTSKKTSDAARANIAYQEAAIEALKTQLDFTQIRAPISGKIGTIKITAGNTVRAYDATPLVMINQITPIKVQIPIPQKYFENVRMALEAGDIKVRVRSQDGAELGTGQVLYRDNQIDAQTRTLSIMAQLENKDERLWPGMFVSTDLILGEIQAAITVPTVAIQKGQSGDYVFAVRTDKAYKIPVQIVKLQGNMAVIKGEVAATDRVVVNNFTRLKDGVQVMVKEGILN